ncbi:flagellin [Clostridium tyrobutyricum]|uniref:flagellin N-terminal helical domain-containing protein n=1 Tax=Clostridium tyrobutyricum TaxID=1519 RepID=UPI001C38A3B1|nr:flagellin [Clostridium tyrobutyricum]MBV4448509.1 flagellin [Clostridium tyrobutyricum]
MIINHNLMANNALRNMNINSNSASKAMEKLSSGLRINRAGDDAAGLAISEKMRGQINGLNQASSNSQDAISLIQTGEGALNETHSILQRMRTLAVQSSTDTNTDDDRTKIQSEVDQLAKEITRISNTTEFNTQNLLAGGLNDTFQIGANAGQNISLSVSAMDASSLGVADSLKSSQNLTAGSSGINTVSNASRGMTAAAGYKVVVDATAASIGAAVDDIKDATNTGGAVTTSGTYTGDADENLIIQATSVAGTSATNTISGVKYSTDNGASWKTATVDMATSGITVDGVTTKIAAAAGAAWRVGDQVHLSLTAASATLTLEDSTSTPIGTAVTVHNSNSTATLGSSTDGKTVDVGFAFSSLDDGTATFDVAKVDSKAATTNDGKVTQEASTVAGIDVSSQGAANTAITAINNAITTVSSERSKLGAYQNRLEHTINNLGTSSENLTSAESRIRDVDMASEMSEYSKNNILSQAAQAMLAQANTQPQQVLQLLR